MGISSNSRHCSASHHTTPPICHYLLKLRKMSEETRKMVKVKRRLKSKKRLTGLSFREKQNPVLKNIEVAGILSEIHPVAAGVYNTAYFVIINQKKQPARTSESLDSDYSETNSVDEKENSIIISKEKPKYTYRELITLALADRTCLTLSNIYSWICKFYPYYSASDEKWKNSIRHNLSLYPEFVKGEKTTDGAGHLWYLDQDFRRNYLQQREERMRRKSEQMNEVLRHKNVEALVEDVMEEEEMKVKEAGTFYHEEAKYRDLITTPELQKSAEEILAGIKRPTAVIGNECFLDNYSFIATQDILDREA